MHIDLDQTISATRAAVEEVNLSLPVEEHVSLDPDAVLYGDGSTLDSIGLVTIVMAVETHVSDITGSDVVLASEAAMSRKRSPYRSLRALAEYAVEITGGKTEESTA